MNTQHVNIYDGNYNFNNSDDISSDCRNSSGLLSREYVENNVVNFTE